MTSTQPYMDQALALAREGVGRVSPNPAVGALLVRNGEIVGSGFHTYAGVRHAEIIALEQAGRRAQGSTLYITLEPCCHQGRTGACTDALIQTGIGRVVAAMEDPNPLVAGKGFARLRDAGIEVEMAPEYADRAAEMNQAFIHFMHTGRPLVILKAAVTLDGKISAPEDNSGWITSERARQHVQVMRHQSDAILTGVGTVLADDPLLTDRSGLERSRPLMRVVLDSTLRIPLESKMVASVKDDLLVVTTSASSPARRAALQSRGVKVTVCDGPDGRVDLAKVVEHLGREKYRSLMIESGSKVNWAALDCKIVDKIYFYYAPKILGGIQSLPVVGGSGRKRRRDAIRFRDVKVHPIPPDEFAVEAWMER
jgi:diaminohydroxyphosphoribosylaminopyrimidine deaminase/5-amino-6-(5-phosphoribosylamino)uracil reductase